MRVSIVLLLAALLTRSTAFAQEEDDVVLSEEQQQQQQQQAPPKTVMAPESQEIVLAETSPECYDSVFAVINGDAEQSALSPECNKELVTGYGKTPMGQLQQKEGYVVQLAGLLRVSAKCRKQFDAAAPKKQEEEGAAAEETAEAQVEISQQCQDEFQQQVKAMQQWVGSTTISRMSAECKQEAATGNVGRDCEQEFLQVKPGVIATLDTQNQQKLKEPAAKEQKQQQQQQPKRDKPAPKPKPWVDMSVVFLLFWTAVLGGSMVYACFVYHRDDTYHPAPPPPVVEEEVEEEEPAAPLSNTKLKQQAREEKRKQLGQGRHF